MWEPVSVSLPVQPSLQLYLCGQRPAGDATYSWLRQIITQHFSGGWTEGCKSLNECAIEYNRKRVR